MKRTLQIATLALALAVTAPAPAKTVTPDPLLGTWIFVAVEEDGSTDASPLLRFTEQTGNRLIAHAPDGATLATCINVGLVGQVYHCYSAIPGWEHWFFAEPYGPLDAVTGNLADPPAYTPVYGWRL